MDRYIIEFLGGNLEYCSISGEYIKYLHLSDISTKFTLNHDMEEPLQELEAGTIYVLVENLRDVTTSMGIMDEETEYYTQGYEYSTLHEFLKRNTLSHINVINSITKESQLYSIPWNWDGNPDSANELQNTSITDDGDILISIKKHFSNK